MTEDETDSESESGAADRGLDVRTVLVGVGVVAFAAGGAIGMAAPPLSGDASADPVAATTATPAPTPEVAVDTTCAFDVGCVVEIDVTELEQGHLNVLANGFVKQIYEPGRYVYRVAPDATVGVTYQNEVLYGEVVADDANAVTDDLRRGADASNATDADGVVVA